MKKKPVLFLVILCLSAAAVIPSAYGQDYNYYALEYFRKTLECMMAGDYQNAILNCNQVIMRDPHSSVNYVIRARAYYELSDYSKAIADCNQAIRLDRNSAAAFLIRGNSYAQTNNYVRAISDWESVIKINPDIEEARLNIELARQRGH